MIEEILKRYLIPGDNYIYGFADLTGLVDIKFKGYNYGISIGKRLEDNIIDPVINGPTREYYSHYKQMNNDLSLLTTRITDDFKKSNIDSIAVDPTVTIGALDTVYLKTLKTDLSHKMVATRAGLGWIGKTDLFISKKFGPRLRLVSILLKNQVISKTKPINKSRCGSCRICVDICPAQAANGKSWDITVEREEFFDPWKCRIQCAVYGKSRLGIDARICGVCVAVCPQGRKNSLQ
jgi:epoxyqueuosine reductase